LDQEKPPKPAKNAARKEPEEELIPDPAVDEFLNRMKYDLRRPKPGQEAIEAALQAMQRLTLETDSEISADFIAENDSTTGLACRSCGGMNPHGHRFCSTCGVPLQEHREAAPDPAMIKIQSKDAPPTGQHHYHHHYHHHYFNSEAPQSAAAERRPAATNAVLAGSDPTRTRASMGSTAPSRNEAAARKVTQDWVSACNTKHLDDLIDLYVADAIVLRPNVPAVRGMAAIREFFFSVLDAGLGEVELEPLRVDLIGDSAYEAGRCKMLVPGALGKRREERGKYLIVMTRQAGEWKIVSDCWSSDLSLGLGAEATPAKSTAQPSITRTRT
jgi:ketosteroid isomerase-like protein